MHMIMHDIKKRIILVIFPILITGCATHGTKELRSKAIMINPGMSKQEVVEILGTPGNRQFQGENEAWQYKSYGMLEDDLHIVWFYAGKVVGYTTETRKDLPFGFDYKSIDWENTPDFILEERKR